MLICQKSYSVCRQANVTNVTKTFLGGTKWKAAEFDFALYVNTATRACSLCCSRFCPHYCRKEKNLPKTKKAKNLTKKHISQSNYKVLSETFQWQKRFSVVVWTCSALCPEGVTGQSWPKNPEFTYRFCWKPPIIAAACVTDTGDIKRAADNYVFYLNVL